MIGLLLIGAWLGLFSYLAALTWTLPLSHSLLCTLLAPATAAPIVGASALATREHAGPTAALRETGRRLWPSALLLTLLPLGLLNPQRIFRPLPLVLTAAAFSVYCARTDHALDLGTASEWQKRAFRFSLLVVAIAIGVTYLAIGATAPPGRFDNDPNYYYAVARHIALTGRYEEQLVWHFLTHPATLLHRPFDYWQGLTALLLVPSFWLFGATHHVASITMAALSFLSLLLFWYLIAVARPLRFAWTQLLALVAFGLSPAMAIFRFDTETAVPGQLVLLAALLSFMRRRRYLAMGLAFALLFVRSDGLTSCVIVWAGVLAWLIVEPEGARKHALARFALVASALLAGYVAFNWLIFHAPAPPGARVVPFMKGPWDLYSYGMARDLRWRNLLPWFHLAHLEARIHAVTATFAKIPFFATLWPWLGGALMFPLAALLRRKPGRELLYFFLVVPGAFIIAWLSPIVFAPRRSLHLLLPAMVMAGAVGFDTIGALFARIDRWLGNRSFARLGTGLLVFTLFYFALGATQLYRPLQPNGYTRLSAKLAALDPILQGQPVMADNPWLPAANTNSPIVKIPDDDSGKVTVIERYDVQWVIQMFDAWPRPPHTQIGPFRIDLVKDNGVKLYRVTREHPPSP